ncbi:type IV pilus assembly protein PilM [Oceanisphaera litoralis]|uniref:type IV pilus assembly protein PilM n=1 Tax=Oceanisphaera litoralis TaxID=225144 RepID=UPI001EF8F1FF|nr:type IV pilus assembly protein PilM [Oceanisphaera litoralis]MBM7456903.1 type IV pilus assembly protein PilM [Oceanisphaera litoralis]
MIGIDFGMSSIKALVLKGTPGDYQLEAMASVPTPKGSIVDHQLQDVDKVVMALKLLRRQLNSSCSIVATAVTGSSVTTKTILVPRSLSPEELETQILLEAEQHIPFPLDEISLDYESLGINANHPDRDNILLSAARTESINTRVSALELAGWETRVMDIGVHALARGVNACLAAEKTEARLLAVVDIGAECLTFVVMEEGEVIYSRLQNFGGAQLSRELARLSDMPAERVEQAKVENTFPVELREDIEQLHINALLQHIRRNIQLFCSSSGNKAPPALFLSGGGSQLPDLAQILQQELSLPVLQPDFDRLFNGVTTHSPDAAAFTTALGLALRSVTPCPI